MPTTLTLKRDVLIGSSRYTPGTRVTVYGPIHEGTWDECYYVVFPNGEETYLSECSFAQ